MKNTVICPKDGELNSDYYRHVAKKWNGNMNTPVNLELNISYLTMILHMQSLKENISGFFICKSPLSLLDLKLVFLLLQKISN